MYKTIIKPTNELVYGVGCNRALVIGWTSIHLIKNAVKHTNFKVLGNLYNKDHGFTELLLNLYYNTDVTEVLFLLGTKQDAISGVDKEVLSFFNKKSTSNSCIPQNVQQELLDGLEYKIFLKTKEFIDYVNKNQPKPGVKSGGVNHSKLLKTKVRQKKLPSVNVVSWHCDNVLEAWTRQLKYLLDKGETKPNTKEALHLTTKIEFQKLNIIHPAFNFNMQQLLEYYKTISKATNYTEENHVSYTYGDYLSLQIPKIIEELKNNKDSRRAYVALNSSKNTHPCLTNLQFKINRDKLYCFTTFRSQDIFKAYPMNTIALMLLMEEIGNELGVEPGQYINTTISAHYYITDEKEVGNKILKWGSNNKFKEDPIGSFLIDYKSENNIVVTLVKGDSRVKYSGSYIKVLRNILNENPDINPKHAAYLGSELYRTLVEKEFYIQI